MIGGDVLSKILDWTDRSTCVLFGDGAGAVVLERVPKGGFLGFELGADGSGGPQLYLPAGGSRAPTTAETVAQGQHFAHMNGREVFKFATRVLVSSAEELLAECGRTIERRRRLRAAPGERPDHRLRGRKAGDSTRARRRERRPVRQHVVGLDPLALVDAEADGRLRAGELVLMTGMGAGLTWGSGLIEWTNGGTR